MKTYENGHRYVNYYKYESKLHQPYDYKREGLMNHLLSNVIINSKNKPLQIMVKFVNDAFVHLLKYIDQLRYFKTYTFFNR